MDTQVSASSGGITFGIPDALSFDRIISGGTCPVSQLAVNLHPYHSGSLLHTLIAIDQHQLYTSTCIPQALRYRIYLADPALISHAQHAIS